MVVTDKAFYNLKPSELQQKCATVAGKTFFMLTEKGTYFIHFLLFRVFLIFLFHVSFFRILVRASTSC